MKPANFKFIGIFLLAALAIVATGCQNKAKEAELTKFKSASETMDNNKELVRQFFTAIDDQNFDKLKELMSDDFSLVVPGLPEPWKQEEVFQSIRTYYGSFPDWKHVIEEMVSEGEKVVVKLTQYGTHTNQFEGLAPTGAKLTKPAVHIVTIMNGKVKEWWGLEDELGFMLQLGMELKPKI